MLLIRRKARSCNRPNQNQVNAPSDRRHKQSLALVSTLLHNEHGLLRLLCSVVFGGRTCGGGSSRPDASRLPRFFVHNSRYSSLVRKPRTGPASLTNILVLGYMRIYKLICTLHCLKRIYLPFSDIIPTASRYG